VPPHDAVCDTLHALSRSAGLTAQREPSNLLTHLAADSERRPDLAVENLTHNGKVLLLDVTTADPAAPSMLREAKSHRSVGGAAQLLEQKKRQAYQGHVNSNLFSFQAVAIELTGRWSGSLSGLFKGLCSRAKAYHNLSPARFALFVGHWRSRLSLALAKALASQAVSLKAQLLAGSLQAPETLELSLYN